MIKLYHYSDKPLDEILTIKRQIKEGIFKGDVKDVTSIDEYEVSVKTGFPYSESISLFSEKLPIDIILKYFPSESLYLRNKIYEHVILIDVELKHWRLVETPIDTFMVNNIAVDILWDNIKLFKYLYFKTKSAIKGLTNDTGYDLISLEYNILYAKIDLRKSFMEWIRSPGFKMQSKRMYAAGVPHYMLYPVKGKLTVFSVKELKIK